MESAPDGPTQHQQSHLQMLTVGVLLNTVSGAELSTFSESVWRRIIGLMTDLLAVDQRKLVRYSFANRVLHIFTIFSIVG